MIKVFIVDDSEIHLEGMKSILKQADTIQITATARQPEEARQILQKESFDLAIVDISLAEEADGLDLAQFIKAHYPHLPVLILSHYKNISYIVRALRLQLNGYLAKDTPAVELIGAIQAVAQGKGFYFGNTIPYNEIIQAFGSEANLRKRKPYELSNREMEVVQLLANGCTSKEIGCQLNIDPNTVETYKDRIKSKLDCKSALEIVVFAYKNKLVL